MDEEVEQTRMFILNLARLSEDLQDLRREGRDLVAIGGQDLVFVGGGHLYTLRISAECSPVKAPEPVLLTF